MKVVFCNPATGALEIGIVYKRTYGAKGKKYHVISELGSVHDYLPSKEDAKEERGYVDFDLTELIIPHIRTNLDLESQANYRDANFVPSIKKVATS